MTDSPLRIAVIGVGVISAQYFASLPRLPGLRLVAVADLDMGRAAEVAAEQGVEARTVDELLASDDVDAVLNLTIPAVHVEVGTRILEAGKHVYAEKPLALSPDEAAPMLALAAERGLRVGSAPDTVLGTGVQTVRRLIDDGAIGQVLTADAHWSAPGHERWHPAPFFYYQPGGGPLLDMGPYYLTALVTLLGPVVRVSGVSIRSPRERTVATGPRAGEAVPVAVDTGVSGILEHASGAVSRVSFSFDTWATRAPLFEVHGTAGSIAVPDPNTFDLPVEAWTTETGEWRTVAANAGYADAGRGYGLADMAHAIATDRPHRASGELAQHVLEIMDAIPRSSAEHAVITLTTTVDRPAAVPQGATPDSW
ncbi:Gfo/Idh/MocA family protein [uncultured Amnibacterium sp.]|uniref:Gfo/Idh/MocA family protein n=1 Tax=uncultured Amnibacterium sp. TaxID=1631851 RepID=UPI0035CC8D46